MSLPDRCKVCAKHTMAQKSFWTDKMVLLGDEDQLEARFSPLGDSANLDARSVHGSCGISFGLFGDGVSVSARRCMVCAKPTIGLDILLDASGGTPR